jgi:hypothetical protein
MSASPPAIITIDSVNTSTASVQGNARGLVQKRIELTLLNQLLNSMFGCYQSIQSMQPYCTRMHAAGNHTVLSTLQLCTIMEAACWQ